MKTLQSIKNGTDVKFNIQGLSISDFEDVDIFNIKEYENQIGKVESLETYCELGDKDFEYYNVIFKGKDDLIGISGYHLTIIN